MKTQIDGRLYQIFVSSTTRDLAAHRQAVVEVINGQNNIPINMETFAASSQKNVSYIADKVRKSDILVLIIGTFIGGVVKECGRISFTEYEYNIAQAAGVKCIAFIADDEDFEKSNTDKRLTRFITRIKTQGTFYRHFSMAKPESLAVVVQQGLQSEIDALRDVPKGGWVHSSRFDEINTLGHLDPEQSKSRTFTHILQRLKAFEALTKRSNIDSEIKAAIAKVFFDRFKTRLIIDKKHNIFIEAGSSCDFLAIELLHILETDDALRKVPEIIKIYLNGVFAKIIFDLRRYQLPAVIDVTYLPKPPISPQYGKTIGVLKDVPDVNKLDYDSNALRKDADDGINLVTNKIKECLEQQESLGIAIIAFGGLDANDGFAPYILEYKNVLFKHAIFRTKTNKIILQTSGKINFRPTRSDAYYRVFDSKMWEEILLSQPVCFVSGGYLEDKCKNFHEFLKKRGFIIEPFESGEIWTYVAYNNLFRDSAL
ncbi:DUF4062 domain-containing protein [Jiella sonneratiae]|uniref:DUF4062 domain-containing protein n=1 Tax=Jiella sonneratiae TaxID=2816856 RepID=A0ABS3J9B8_9HYPH|nr:DUF4062 domain-containing protein [Jiella sonneratiae]MBO0906274.1 DUF4062 domain-containing protein [Jiella sonneratiae]